LQIEEEKKELYARPDGAKRKKKKITFIPADIPAKR